MRIMKLEIEGLHGEYDYSVRFDGKLTFLFGPNGSGKTTILNILASIVTGKIYNLSEYEFEKIALFYRNKPGKGRFSQIVLQNEKNGNLNVRFDGKDNRVRDFWDIQDRMVSRKDAFRLDNSLEESFEEAYPFVKTIRETFNYAYLPLNRYGVNYDFERDIYYYKPNTSFRSNRNPYNNYLNESLLYITKLIKDNCARINVSENEVNNQFRQDLLTSAIRVEPKIRLSETLRDMKKYKWRDIEEVKSAYIRILLEMKIYREAIRKQIETFFDAFHTDFEQYKQNKAGSLTVDLVWQYSEFLKIRDITSLAKENEQNKEQIRKPRKQFVDVINGFFANSGSDKKISISKEGSLIIESIANVSNHPLGLTELSSGEKQIIIIFASLIFGLQEGSTGIYIVDEPEASLHLEWQSQFVDAILQVNDNIQLVFATHSPELIGRYREHAVELKRTRSK